MVDDEVGSVSSENTDACSEITDVSLETSASGAGAGVGAGLSYAKQLRRRSRGKRDVGMGRRRRRRRRRERLRAEQREREQLGREVQQRLDFVRWEGRQESKWEAAAAAVVA